MLSTCCVPCMCRVVCLWRGPTTRCCRPYHHWQPLLHLVTKLHTTPSFDGPAAVQWHDQRLYYYYNCGWHTLAAGKQPAWYCINWTVSELCCCVLLGLTGASCCQGFPTAACSCKQQLGFHHSLRHPRVLLIPCRTLNPTLHSCLGSCVLRSQNRNVVSPEPLAKYRPLGLNCTVSTDSE